MAIPTTKRRGKGENYLARKGENEDDIDDRGEEFHQRRWGREDDVEARRWRSRWAWIWSLIKHANNCLRRPADGGNFVVVVN